MFASIIIRTFNEARHLDEVLKGISQQETVGLEWETILVDSGSTDGTLEIAKYHDCRIYHITREEFTFGHSLNIGCEAAKGDFLVLVSGHCVPVDKNWLQALCQPLMDAKAEYTYGRQLGGPGSYFSECRIFSKYYPEQSRIPQEGFFCNNANSALTKSVWRDLRFNEELTGLEDMEFTLRLTKRGGKVAYVADASIFHYHDEDWQTVKRRFEREALALQHILPQVHIHKYDLVRYIITSIWLDWRCAWRERTFMSKVTEIVLYRFWQYWGSYKGNHDHRKLSHADKEVYFYPSTTPSLSNPRVVGDTEVANSALKNDVSDARH